MCVLHYLKLKKNILGVGNFYILNWISKKISFKAVFLQKLKIDILSKLCSELKKKKNYKTCIILYNDI